MDQASEFWGKGFWVAKNGLIGGDRPVMESSIFKIVDLLLSQLTT